MAEFFGFEINRKGKDKELPKVSFVPNTDEDGAGVITSGGHFGAYLDMDGDKAKNEVDLIMKYRDVAAQPEAVEAGVAVLRAGGNAVDAAIACGLIRLSFV